MGKINRIILAALISIGLLINSPIEVLAAKSRRDKGAAAFVSSGVGFLLLASAPISDATLFTGLRNYAIAYGVPQGLKELGLNKSWQNIGGAILAIAVTGINIHLPAQPCLHRIWQAV